MGSLPMLEQSLFGSLYRLWNHIDRLRRRQLKALLFLMVLTAITEVIGIGSILPFLSVLADPDLVFNSPHARPFVEFFNLTTSKQLLLPITLIFILSTLFSGLMRLFLLWAQTNLGQSICVDISTDYYRKTLYQPYSFHLNQNSSEVIAAITGKSSAIAHQILLPALTILSSLLLAIAIMATLLIIQPFIAISAFLGFGLIYVVVIKISKRILIRNSQCISEESVKVIKALQEGLGGIRDVLLDGTQDAYCKMYRNADFPMRRAYASIAIISTGPRYVIEAIGMILIAIFAYALAGNGSTYASVIPVLGALALGAQRLLPIMQQGYASWSSMRAGQASLNDVLIALDYSPPKHLTLSDTAKIPFHKNIALKNVSFKYGGDTPSVLNGIDLTIAKGSRVGFIGATGCGKSTLLDIIMGLLEPTGGRLFVDDAPILDTNCRQWQRRIAHVPQSIFLADTTVAENIAFGVPKNEINFERVRLAAEQAQIAVAIESWVDKYETLVGERGLRLSGGQRQRIGIARALYKEADVFVLDEATSALDNETEIAVVESMEALSSSLTFIIVAHRLTSLRNCDQIIELKKGAVSRVCTYEEMMTSSK